MPAPLPDPDAGTGPAIHWNLDAGFVYPSAMPAREGDVEALGGATVDSDEVSLAGLLAASPIDDLEVGVRGWLPIFEPPWVENSGRIRTLSDPTTAVYDALYYGWVRWNAFHKPWLNVAPWLGFGRYSVDWMTAVGLAVEGGWRTWRLDASAPIVLAFTVGDKGVETGGSGRVDDNPNLTTPDDFDRFWSCCSLLEGGFEAGLRWMPAERHAIRVGARMVLGVDPAIGWRYQGEHLELAADWTVDLVHPRGDVWGGWRF